MMMEGLCFVGSTKLDDVLALIPFLDVVPHSARAGVNRTSQASHLDQLHPSFALVIFSDGGRLVTNAVFVATPLLALTCV